MKEPKVIVFDRRKLFGDIVVSIPALYLTKQLYPQARLIFITNAIGKNLCQNFSFIDEIIELDKDSDDKFVVVIEKIAPDILILGHRSSKNITLAHKSKCPKVITWLHLKSMFLPRFNHPKYLYKGRRREITSCIDLVRSINPRKFDKTFKTFGEKIFTNAILDNAMFDKMFGAIFGNTHRIKLQNIPISVKPNPQNLAHIDNFLDSRGGALQDNYWHPLLSWQKWL